MLKQFLPAKERVGLKSFVCDSDLPNPNSTPNRLDGDPAHPHLLAQSAFTCLQRDYRAASETLVRRRLSRAHGQKFSRSSRTGATRRPGMQSKLASAAASANAKKVDSAS
jgi:hypothetical protein